ncbi:HDIG domain-containing protein [Phormidium sp. LEGE 05292]|uniref:HD family phosphohydrolase n=1 Tax=[Phormidium] sp. LEGE 05292 TaxID=767427 RepID=UPI00187E60F0|nr:HDIG domain-containing metalloprotein [Phormidium sp. LEGE 05292]MBE9229034.1 HDIG domain-containing protein [Phormidium sp. LEGE 05292]
MKTFSWTQKLKQWRRIALSMAHLKTFKHTYRSSKPNPDQEIVSLPKVPERHESIYKLVQKHLRNLIAETNPCQTQVLNCRRSKTGKRPKVALVMAVISLTSTMGHRFYNQPKLDVDTVAPSTILAPRDATVPDPKTTEAKQKAARRGLIPVLMVDPVINNQIYQDLQQKIQQINHDRRIAGQFPFTSVLSTATQIYLRSCSESEWQAILAALNNASEKTENINESPTSASPSPVNSPQLQQVINELKVYRRINPEGLATLINTISQVRQRYAQALANLSSKLIEQDDDSENLSFLELTEEDWRKTQEGIPQALERILTQGIAPGLPLELKQQVVKIQLKHLVPETAQPVVTQLIVGVLKPNLIEDAAQTKLQAEQAVQQVKPEIVEIKKGEIIVKAGQQITQREFVLLDHFKLSRREVNWWALIGCGVLVIGGVGVFWWVEKRFHPGLRQRDHVLILLLALSTPLLVSFGVNYSSLPAVGLLVGSFYGSALGVTTIGLLTLGLPIGLENILWDHLLANAAGAMVGSLMAGRLRSREELALLGITIGLTEGIVYLTLNLLLSASVGSIWLTILQEAAIYSLTGVAWSVVALGISPYLEQLFDLVTPVRLAELANPNRPLLKRLAEEAPGTFQHTLFVATLAEAAAKALDCNVELVRTGTLYHDIGKLHDPQGFIENQMGGPNKHDQINDPYFSAAIIKKHVTEGIVMARRYRLPKVIQAFIPEHQGTMQIAYFYHQAKQEAKGPIDESFFRYAGPIPQSRETGVVMLADSCEAALRSLKDATYEEALAMVNKILKARWQDNQLVDSGLTRAEMSQIAEIFVQVWQQFHHKRIAYPKAVLNNG